MTTYIYKRQSELPESIDDFCGELVPKVVQQEREVNLTIKDRILSAGYAVTTLFMMAYGTITDVKRSPEDVFPYIIAGELICVATVILAYSITGKHTERRYKMNFCSIKYGPYFNHKL